MSISEAKSGILQIRGEWEAGKYQAHHAATMIGNLLLGAFDHIAHTPDGTVFVEDVRTSAKREMLHQDEDGNLVRQNEALPRGWHAFVRAAYLLIQWTGPCPFAGHEHEYLTVGVERIVAWLNRQSDGHIGKDTNDELLPASPITIPPPSKYSASDDFTSVQWFGTRYTFSKGNQAESIRALWYEWEKGAHSASEKTIGEKVGSSNGNYRLSQTFRKHPAWKTMIVGEGKGKFKLSPPNSSEITE